MNTDAWNGPKVENATKIQTTCYRNADKAVTCVKVSRIQLSSRGFPMWKARDARRKIQIQITKKTLAHSKLSKVRAMVTSMAKTTLSSNDASEKKCQKVQFDLFNPSSTFEGVSSFLRNLKHSAFKVQARPLCYGYLDINYMQLTQWVQVKPNFTTELHKLEPFMISSWIYSCFDKVITKFMISSWIIS